MRIFILIFLMVNISFASCPIKIDCTGFIQSTKEINIQILNTAYMSLDKTMDMMFELEEEYKKKLEEQNRLLTDLENLEKAGLEYEKNISFLIEQNNGILDKIIDIDLTEKLNGLETKKWVTQ